MKQLFAFLRVELEKAAFHLLIWSGLFLFVTWFYRYRLLTSAVEIYREYRFPEFLDYIIFSLRQDLPVFALFLGFVILLRFLIRGKSRWWETTLQFLLLLSYLSLCLGALEFMRIYEIPLDLSLLGQEDGSGWREVWVSAAAELTPLFWNSLIWIGLTMAVVLFGGWWAGNRLAASRPEPPRFLRGWRPGLALFLLAMAGLFQTLLWAGAPGWARDFPRLKETKESAAGDLVRATGGFRLSLVSLTQNPVAAVFFPPRVEGVARPLEVDTQTEDLAKFRFGFASDSLAQKAKILPRLSALPRGKKYNILLFIMESTGARYIGLKQKGKPVTPNIDRVKENSLVFDRHYANYPLSVNAVYEIFHSAWAWPLKRLVIKEYPGIGLAHLPGLLKQNGYATGYMTCGDLSYAAQRRYLRGLKFDQIVESKQLFKSEYNQIVGWGVDDRSLIKPATEFMTKRQKAGQPFFLTLFPVSPHHPYAVPGPEFRLDGDPDRYTTWKDRMYARYLDSLYFADHVFGRVLENMEKNGLLENTLVVLVGDHGEAFYQHRGNANHPFFLYEENTHVPFFIYQPKHIKKRKNYSGISRHIDITPTLLDILKLPVPPRAEGMALLAPRRPRMAFSYTWWRDRWAAVHDGPWKLMWRFRDDQLLLHHLERDPEERKNLAGEKPDLVEKYQRKLKANLAYRMNFYRKVLGEQFPKPAWKGKLNPSEEGLE